MNLGNMDIKCVVLNELWYFS